MSLFIEPSFQLILDIVTHLDKEENKTIRYILDEHIGQDIKQMTLENVLKETCRTQWDLAEILYYIERFDLLHLSLGLEVKNVREYICNSGGFLSRFKITCLKIHQSLTSKEVAAIHFFLQTTYHTQLQLKNNFLSLMSELHSKNPNIIQDTHILLTILTYIQRKDLIKTLKIYL